MGYTPTIGLEIHAELNTRTKMFCSSANDPHSAAPNTHVCPVCMAFPGTLPVINKEALRHVLRVGAAVGGTLAEYTEFDRKNYFYPDIPKGFQISQYKYPLVSGGELAGVTITRIHLEEDTARSQHSGDASLVDFNRAGVPLMELVTEPVIHDAETAVNFAEELQLLLKTLGVSHANMERGEMRVEVNISISEGSTLGTKVEVKNLNSFKSVGKAIDFEIARHLEVIRGGGSVVQETRGFNEVSGTTFSQRLKESAHDYRYFPEPDIPKLNISRIDELSYRNIHSSLPELPWKKRERLTGLGIKESDVEVLVNDDEYASLFEDEISHYFNKAEDIQLALNYLLSDIRGLNPTESELKNLRGGVFAETINLLKEGKLSSRGAKDLLKIMLKNGGKPEYLAQASGLMQISDTKAIEEICIKVVEENPTVVEQVKGGKETALMYLVGQAMKASKGSANPQELKKTFESIMKA